MAVGKALYLQLHFRDPGTIEGGAGEGRQGIPVGTVGGTDYRHGRREKVLGKSRRRGA